MAIPHEINDSLDRFFRLVDITDNETEVPGAGSFTVEIAYAKDSPPTLTAISDHTVDESGKGLYVLRIPGSHFNQVGQYAVRIETTNANIFTDTYDVYDPVADAKRVAVQVLTMTVDEVLAHADAAGLPQAEDARWRQCLLIAAVEGALPRALDTNGDKLIKKLDGTIMVRVPTVATAPVTDLNVATETG